MSKLNIFKRKIKYIFIDMDNTLAKFSDGGEDDKRALELSYDEGFYLNLKPMKGIWIYKILKILGFNLYILSCCNDSKYCKKEKIEWVQKYMPYISFDHIILCNQDKVSAAKNVIGNNLKHSALIDDYGVNLYEWEKAGGLAIKKAHKIKKRNYPHINYHYEILKILVKYEKNEGNNVIPN